MAEELGIGGRVHFLGYRTDVADVTQVYDVAVLPSVAGEGLPHAVLEAMALRKPMVASRFSGIPEEVEEGVTGTLVPRGDVKGLAGAIIDLLTNPEKARAFGEAGRRRVEEKFALKRMLDETFALYEELLCRKPKAGGRLQR
jgi:glycosyltransferase involved in cell wall biosynthesis